MQLNVKWQLAPVTRKEEVARGSLKTLAYHNLPKYELNAKNIKILKQNLWQLAPFYPINNSKKLLTN